MKYTQGLDWEVGVFDLVVLDEASQMSLPEAVLACAFLKPGGQVVVVGDHRQMPPILTRGWKEEGRREAETFQPFRSVFQFLLDLQVPKIGLDESFRVPRVLAEFLAEHIYRQDQIPYFSRRTERLEAAGWPDPFLEAALHPEYPIVVIEHDDERSQQANKAEAGIVVPIVTACAATIGLDGQTGVGIVVPHRAQKALLGAHLVDLRDTGAIDTVERFQGGERDVIIVSATVSDPDYALAEAAFLMDAKRLNVALSRPKKKLIVVGAANLFRLLPSDPDVFEQASLWKVLRFQYSDTLLRAGVVNGVGVRVYGRTG